MLKRFWMVFKLFFFCLSLSVLEKLKISIFKMPIITKTLNINKMRTKSAEAMKLHSIRKLFEYSLKHFVSKGNVYLPVFKILLSVGMLVLWPVQRGTWSNIVNISVANKENVWNLLKVLEKWLNYQLRRFWIVFRFF